MVKKTDPWGDQVLNHKGQRLDEHGREILDPRVIDPPIGHIKQPPLHELIRTMVMNERIRQELEAAGVETLEDADDFDVDDEMDPSSPYEENFDHLGVQGAVPPADAPAGSANPAESGTSSSVPPAPGGSTPETKTG